MRRTEHLGARVLTTLGLLASVAYLVWRATASMAGSHVWVSIPALALEAVAVLGAVVLAWALWPLPAASAGRRAAGSGAPSPAARSQAAPLIVTVDAVVRVQAQAEHEVRATLLALRSVRSLEHVVVVDLSARPSVALLSVEFQAVYAASDPADHNGLQVMLAAVRTPHFLLLDAGDVPTHDIIERLHPHAASQVAVVQGLGTAFAPDSAEHGPGGRHELAFERRALNPALGTRGCAAWTGSGSLVNTAALGAIEIDGGHAVGAHWRFGAALLAAGWRIAAPAETVVVVHRTIDADAEVRGHRVQRADAARRTVFGRGGALRMSRHTLPQRLSLLACAVRPLSGLRRALFVALLAAAVVGGAPPFQASTLAIVCLWLPAFLYTSLGLSLLSGWALRPGDRTRASLQAMGPAWASLRATDAGRAVLANRARFGHPAAAARRRARSGTGVAIAVVGLSLALVVRGVSDRLTHTLPAVATAALMAMLLVGLWLLGLSLDVLRMLARRTQLRRSVRVQSSLAATLDDRAVSIVDVNALGAGVLSQTELAVGERMLLESAVTTSSGVTTVQVPCVVRNLSRLSTGEWRLGVEFGAVGDAAANALAEYCTIEPVWERLGVLPGRSVTEARRVVLVDEPDGDGRLRTLVRIVSLLALVGAVASSAPSVVEASPIAQHRVQGVVEVIVDVGEPPVAGEQPGTPDTAVPDSLVETNEPVPTTIAPVVESAMPEGEDGVDGVDGVDGAVVVAVCSLEQGVDGQWGTADDVYGEVATALTDADGSYELALVGEACWAAVAPPAGYEPEAAAADVGLPGASVLLSRPVPLDVSGAVAVQQPVVLGAATPAADSGADAPSDAVVVSDVRDAFSAEVPRPVEAGGAPQQVLPAPAPAQVAGARAAPTTLSLVVLMLAGLLAASILLGLARPRGAMERGR